MLRKTTILFILALLVTISTSYAQKMVDENIESPYKIVHYPVNERENIIFRERRHGLGAEHVLRKNYLYNGTKEENARLTGWLRTDEFLIDTSVVYVSAGGNQDDPVIAFDGTNYLVVWLDDRDGYIYGARVHPSGVILDSAGIAISTVESRKSWPAVAFDGTNYLVVWSEIRNYPGEDIYGARVSTSGVVLDPDGIAISTTLNRETDPTVAFDGTNYLVVWADDRNGPNNWDIYGARVSPSGVVLDPEGIAISTEENIQGDPVIAFDGTNYLIVWDDYRNYSTSLWDIYGARVSPSGTVLDTAGIAVSAVFEDQGCPAIAFDGTNYLVVWKDMRSGTYDVYCTLVNQSGIVLDRVGIPICSTGDTWSWFSAVAFDGTNYLVVWADEQTGTGFDLYGARVSPSGIVLDTAGIVISTEMGWQFTPGVAFDGTNYLVVWSDSRALFSGTIYGARINQSGVVLEPEGFLVPLAANNQDCSSIAFDGTNYLVVWQDNRSGYYNIYGARVNQSATVLDPIGFAISTETSHQTYPAVTFDGTNYLVVWSDDRNEPGTSHFDIYGARVSTSGVVLDPEGIAISTNSSYGKGGPDVAFDGTNYLVVWQENIGYDLNIYGARVSISGAILDTTSIAISTAIKGQFRPAVAFDSTNYLVVWMDYRNDPGNYSNSNIYGARIEQSGTVLDPSGIAISTAINCQMFPSLAFDGTNYLVVWQDERSGSEWDIFGARLNQSGILLDTLGIVISDTTDDQKEPSIAFDGTEYLVVWRDNCSSSFSDIYGAKVSPSGTIIDEFAVSIQPGNQKTPVLANGTADSVLITYSGWTDSIYTRPANAMRIWGKLYPFVGIAENGRFMVKNSQYNLHVYPNPFTHNIKISFSVEHNAKGIEQRVEGTELKIYDATGRLIKSFSHVTNQIFDQVVWDGRDDVGKKLPSGVYFLKLVTGDYSTTEKLLMIR